MAEDIRVVLIKLADRLHNMRTLYALPSDKQLRIARQTLEIYAPLAERLGIWSIKWELEDLAFKSLEPESYRELARALDTRRKGRESFVEKSIEALRPELAAAGIEPSFRAARNTSQHLEEDAAQGFGNRRDLRRLRHPRARGRSQGLLRRARRRPLDVAADPEPVRRLHRGTKPNLYQSLHTRSWRSTANRSRSRSGLTPCTR